MDTATVFLMGDCLKYVNDLGGDDLDDAMYVATECPGTECPETECPGDRVPGRPSARRLSARGD